MLLKNFLVLLLLLGSLLLNGQQLDHVLGDLIIQIHPKLEDPYALLKQHRTVNGKATDWKVKKCLSKEANIWLVQIDFTTTNEFHALRALRSHNLIKQAQFNHLLEKRNIPNDPNFREQWNWLNTGTNGGLSDADIDAEEAWDITTGGVTVQGDTIVIAVLDEGIDLNHNDLKANLWKNHAEIPNNGIDDDENGYIDDFHGWNVNTESDGVDHSVIANASGHGTEVAGVIGAVGNNALQLSGINWTIKLMILAPYGIGSDNEASAIEGYNYVLESRKLYNETNGVKGAFVIATNSSWGIPNAFESDAPIWCEFYDLLGQEGIINTVATVNSNTNIDIEGDLPTTCTSPFLIGVSNSNNRDNKSNNAGYGPQSIDLFAPAENIPVLTRFNGVDLSNSGTSYASPTVAGVAGLLYAAPCNNFISIAKQNPTTAAQLVRSYLLEGVDKKTSLTEFSTSGGRLNANISLQLLLDDCGPCPPILGVSFDKQELESDLTINWVADTAQLTTLRFRTSDNSAWATLSDLRSPFNLGDLSACTVYEFQFAIQCDNGPLSYSESFFQQTDGCCEAPTDVQLMEVGEEILTIEWPSILSATSYEIEWSVIGQGSKQLETTAIPNYTFSNLSPCSDLEIRIRPICPARNTVFSIPYNFSTKGCGVCTDVEYCSSKGEDTLSEWIEQVKFNGIDNLSGTDRGYGDYASLSTDVAIFSTYTLELIPGFADSNYEEYFRVWIDYNQDGKFDNITEVVFDAEEPSALPVTSEITIPESAKLGLTRMRVAMVADFDAIARTPCTDYRFGEVEDYCVNIVEGDFRCLPPQSIQIIEANTSSIELGWELGTSIQNTTIRYKKAEENTWNEKILEQGETPIITDLIPCANYEVQILNSCTNGESSEWSDITIVSTFCDCSAPTNIQFEKEGTTGLIISWDPIPSASSYAVFYALIDGSSSTEVMVEDSKISILDLPDCFDLNVAITPFCLGERGNITEFPSINNCTVSTVDKIKEIERLSVYPNPFQDELFLEVEFASAIHFEWSMWSLDGRLVYRPKTALAPTSEITTHLNVSHLPKGVYFFKINTPDNQIVKKVVSKFSH